MPWAEERNPVLLFIESTSMQLGKRGTSCWASYFLWW